MKFTDGEYKSIDRFCVELFHRVEVGKMAPKTAHSHLMHVLTAYDKGNESEFVPYIGLMFAKWLKEESNA